MRLSNVLVATDRSPGGLHAVRVAAGLVRATGARWSVVQVLPPDPGADGFAGQVRSSLEPARAAELSDFRRWLGDACDTPGSPPEIALAFGVPGIEIGRLATLRRADLIVAGREPRTPEHRLLLGETADALVRRSGLPILFVPPDVRTLGRILLALDPSARSARVASVGVGFARATGATTVQAVTVELAGVPAEAAIQSDGRTMLVDTTPLHASVASARVAGVPLTVRQGEPVDEVLLEANQFGADLLVIGYRRGGPPKIVGPTEVARRLLYSSPAAILTVSL